MIPSNVLSRKIARASHTHEPGQMAVTRAPAVVHGFIFDALCKLRGHTSMWTAWSSSLASKRTRWHVGIGDSQQCPWTSSKVVVST